MRTLIRKKNEPLSGGETPARTRGCELSRRKSGSFQAGTEKIHVEKIGYRSKIYHSSYKEIHKDDPNEHETALTDRMSIHKPIGVCCCRREDFQDEIHQHEHEL